MELKWLRTFLSLQCLVALAGSLVCYLYQGKAEALLSGLIGGAIAILPALPFIRLFFKYQGASQAKHIIRNLYLGEGLKLLMTFGLFTLAFQSGKLKAAPLLGVFIITQAVYWSVPWIAKLQLSTKIK